ncbi:hypothetical protein W97_08399 [Coniosporium apollinis CBS 100218]|uniref:Heterokaryon incompatibility domain-containing protein n=1 Tax=Coniosporium apollinis (strain CBS 100218) TaxID=1168221 RepID=R7Z5B4_CONA1|nr:uncharacterized protein W97_08399 [Coniosporium apollinis CBS 100218]EON69086.1 hypothetical protein W97_08399 [Coniosporium apollinis CBS 100218]
MAQSNGSEPYQYTKIDKLDSIRLLELLPGTDDPLRCMLVEVRLSQKPTFEALSYTWGGNEFPNRIDEISSQSALYITDNLRDALRALRPKSASRILWVDALCINQSDNVEKGWQVGMMKDIYQSASKVVVWLGKQHDHPDVAEIEKKGFEELERIGRNCSLYGFDTIFPPFPRAIVDQSALGHFKELAKDCNGLSLLAIYHREWYERVWVVQEFILAKDLILQSGSRSVSYELFSKATAVLQLMARRRSLRNEWISNRKGLPQLFFRQEFDRSWRLIQQRERYWGMRETQYSGSTAGTQSSTYTSVYAYEDPVIRPSSIIEYCAFGKNLKCSNEVDRVYGMLGIAYDSLSIEPDYSSAPEKVWETLAVKTLLLGDLTVLHYAGVSATRMSRVRSFAADFGRWSNNTRRLGGHGYPKFHAATQIPAKVELEEDGCMRVHAIKVDTVNRVNFAYLKDEDAPSPSTTEVPGNVNLSGQPDFIRIDQDALQQLYKWWMYWLAAKGPRYYSDRIGKWAFPRTIIADNALPITREEFAQYSLEAMDLLFVIFMLVEESSDDTGNTKTFVDTWKVYEWMGKPMKISLSTFTNDENFTTYHFPSRGAGQEQDDVLHTMLSLYESGGIAEAGLEYGRARIQDILGFTTLSQAKAMEITSPLKEQLELYVTVVSMILSQRHLFFTNVRFLGIGPKGMRPGDVIMVPEGSQTPFVYRRMEGGEDNKEGNCVRRGELIGECYIHGLMEGKPAQQLEADYTESHIEVILN